MPKATKAFLGLVFGGILCLLIFALVCFLILMYHMNWKQTTITTITNEDNGYSVTFLEIGEPFSFGPSGVKVILKDENGKKIAQITDQISNDGGRLRAENISVLWGETEVLVILRGAEQKEKTHTFSMTMEEK